MAGADMDTDTQIAIVGAGLCGLALAEALIGRGYRVRVLDGRERIGGRVLSRAAPDAPHARYDLGPAWIWPHNTRMRLLADRLNVSLMEQNATGTLVFEDRNGRVQRDLDFATMAGAMRVVGGLATLPERLAERLSAGAIHLSHRVTGLHRIEGGVRLTGATPHGAFDLRAERVVLALPPRLVSEIDVAPSLGQGVSARLPTIPTWMAAQAKFMAVYARPFWRRSGLSGDAISHRGPLFEIHDASIAKDPKGEAALFGFVQPDALRANPSEAALTASALDQMIRLFGDDAGQPVAVYFKHWGADDLTATRLDRPDLTDHPIYRPVPITEPEWQGRLHLTGSETAAEDGGFLEGALEAAERTLREIATETRHA
jgi:monoamine oxidase